jgi:hypothetical protein
MLARTLRAAPTTPLHPLVVPALRAWPTSGCSGVDMSFNYDQVSNSV